MTRTAIQKWAKRIVIDCLVIVLAQYLIVLFASTFLLNSILFQPHPPDYTWQTPHIINIGDERIPVAAYWQPHTHATIALLYSHGNAEDIGDLTERIRNISCRKLFIHGTHDSVIPFWHGKKMYELSGGIKQYHWVPEAGHDDLLLCFGEKSYTKLIKDFADR
jgi:pimeloyl-ACP methyl ester carboxylesterase